jgi:hypothetical protein
MMINRYDSVADLYDIYVPVTYDVDFFVREAKKAPGEVLELMSGTGRVSIPLLQAGVPLTCVDFSAGLNAVLEGKLQALGLRADVYAMDVCELELNKQFSMVIIPFSSFAHITSPDEQRKALVRIREHLVRGGTFICTLGNPKLRKETVDGQLRLAMKYALPGTQGLLLLWNAEAFSDEDGQVVEAMQFYEAYDANGVLQSKRVLELHFRLSPKEEFEELAKAAGLRVRALYGDYDYSEFGDDSPVMIWVLENAG